MSGNGLEELDSLEPNPLLPKLQTFVWEDVLCDYTCGMIVVAAYSLDQARQMAIEKIGAWNSSDVLGMPTILNHLTVIWTYGGG